jgi:hypothetical protein
MLGAQQAVILKRFPKSLTENAVSFFRLSLSLRTGK